MSLKDQVRLAQPAVRAREAAAEAYVEELKTSNEEQKREATNRGMQRCHRQLGILEEFRQWVQDNEFWTHGKYAGDRNGNYFVLGNPRTLTESWELRVYADGALAFVNGTGARLDQSDPRFWSVLRRMRERTLVEAIAQIANQLDLDFG